jgi:hypothetical protein
LLCVQFGVFMEFIYAVADKRLWYGVFVASIRFDNRLQDL